MINGNQILTKNPIHNDCYVKVLGDTKKSHKSSWCSRCWSGVYPYMNDNELGLELAEIVRKEQEEAAMLHREQKDVAKTDIPKRRKTDWEALTEEEYGSSAVAKNPAVTTIRHNVASHLRFSKPIFTFHSLSYTQGIARIHRHASLSFYPACTPWTKAR